MAALQFLPLSKLIHQQARWNAIKKRPVCLQAALKHFKLCHTASHLHHIGFCQHVLQGLALTALHEQHDEANNGWNIADDLQ